MNLKDIRISKELTQLEASLICSISLRTYKRLELDRKYKQFDKYKKSIQSLNEYKNADKSLLTSKTITVAGQGFVKVYVSLRDGIALTIIRNNFIHVTLIRCIQSKQMMDASFLS